MKMKRPSIKCPHCNKEILAKTYRVYYLTKDNEQGSLKWEDCYGPQDAAHCMISFDDNVSRILKVEEVSEG